jgi:hypothetical protein
MRILLGLLASLAVLLAVVLFVLWPRYPYLPAQASPWQVERVGQFPLIEDVAEERGYFNINGPSVIRVPDWVENPFGKYYLYFAHHKGGYIRMAYADEITGPWQVYHPGVLSLADSGFPVELNTEASPWQGLADLFTTFSPYVVRDYLILGYNATVADPAQRQARGMTAAANKAPHIASPEVIVDEENQRLLMFFHGYDERGIQSSGVAASSDGMGFVPLDQRIPSTYLRAFEYRGQNYLLGMPGVLFRSDSITGPWQPRSKLLFQPDMRHAGLWLDGSTLYVFWSMVGYAPERLLLSTVDLSAGDWDDWVATAPVDVLLPELAWEGGELNAMPSLRGELDVPAKELRDPYVIRDEDGQLYLFYVGGGEKAIGVARLQPPQDSDSSATQR